MRWIVGISAPASPSLVRETMVLYSAKMDERRFWVYLLASQRNGTLYCGVTNNLSRRIFEHRNSHTPGFTSKYGVTRLVWYEEYSSIIQARAFEDRLKRWKRVWKLELIEKNNPEWKDLYDTLTSPFPGQVRRAERRAGNQHETLIS